MLDFDRQKIVGAKSVTEINAEIKACLNSPYFENIKIFGEVSGFKKSGAHAYFTLKDKNSAISCTCFSVARTHQPKDGDSVIMFGSVDYYQKGGRLSFVASTIEPVGQGMLFLEFQKLKLKFESEGLFDRKYKKPIPVTPNNVLVVTSATGAVIRDIITTIRRKNPVIDIVVKDVRVQGDTASKQITDALISVDRLGYDVIILARGGGSLEDLAPFLDEKLSRTVFEMKTPIISAIGHETDFTLVDFVADYRAPTPTAAGELVGYDYYKMIGDIKDMSLRLKSSAMRNFATKSAKFNLLTHKLKSGANQFYDSKQAYVLSLCEKAKSSVVRQVEKKELKLEKEYTALLNLNPLNVLKRGYYKIDLDGKQINKIEQIKIGDNIRLHGQDGYAKATITDTIISKEHKDGK